MHADERLSALGQATGSAEVAAEALTATKRALHGKPLRQAHLQALRDQIALIDLLTESEMDVRARASMLTQAPYSLRSLRSLSGRLGLPNKTRTAEFKRARGVLEKLAKRKSKTSMSASHQRSIAEADADVAVRVCKRVLEAAIGLLGAANQVYPDDTHE